MTDDEMPTGEAFLAAYRSPELADPPLPVARLIRHYCPTPEAARGLVWRCECGRKWKTFEAAYVGRSTAYGWEWRRTYWPWPR